MNTLSTMHDKNTRILKYLPIVVLALLFTLFVCNSFPMMRPGFDIWTHLGLIEAPQEVNSSKLPPSRIIWHHLWSLVLHQLDLSDLFDRALVIHRVQAAATILLVSTGGYFILHTLFGGKRLPRSELWFSAMMSAGLWLIMNGTESTARDGGPDAYFVQSWLSWYSINYQISLPLYFASTGALLFSMEDKNKPIHRGLTLIFSIACISLATLLHAAETAYFLICLGIIAILYFRGHNKWLFGFGVLAFGGFGLWAATLQSYVAPALLKILLSDDWSSFYGRLVSLGEKLTSNGLNRMDTGWHVIHTVSAFSLLVAGIIHAKCLPQSPQTEEVSWRPWLFVGLTALMPLALMLPITAGLLAMVTHLNIAWRFAFASFIFLGIPALGIAISLLPRRSSSIRRQLVQAGLVITTSLAAITYSYSFEEKQPSFRFASSLLSSLDREDSYFGLSEEARGQLKKIASTHRSANTETLICTDLFTAYYLFFVEHFHAVNMPTALRYVPGYQDADPNCEFGPSLDSLPREKMYR